MGRAERITYHLKKHDRELYCAEDTAGTLCVYRKTYRYESYDVDGKTMIFARPAPYFIFALTDTWRANGKSADWGIEPIMSRIKALDLWNRDLASDLIEKYQESEARNDRHFNNEAEAFFSDQRSKFKNTFADVNTANMKKIDKRRSKENGYR